MAGNLETVKMLMRYEGWEMLNVEDTDNWTLLYWACQCRENEEVIELLNAKGANPDQETKYGWRPIDIAVFHHPNELVRLLNPVFTGPAGDKVPDILDEHPQQLTLPLENRTSKLDLCQSFRYTCNGCQQTVSLTIRQILVPL